MGTRTVRLDEQTEALLTQIRRVTGLSVSDVLKQGVRAVHDQALSNPPRKPYDVYAELDLGPGGYAIAPSTSTRTALLAAIRRKHRR